MKQSETFFVPKIPKIYHCILCDYNTSNKKDYNKHLLTQKHKNRENETIETSNSKEKDNAIQCFCGNIFNSRTTLWRHKKKCSNQLKTSLTNEQTQHELIQYLMKENSEFKQLMIEQNKSMIELAKNSAGHNNNNNNNNTTNNNNNTNNFNLNFYLNETCKNAMNIMDFVNQLQIKNNDLEETARLGFAEGISKIFINGLKQINIPDRPIHCSDTKRETLYIKDNNEWNKETDDKIILTNAIKQVAHKNMKQISEWTKIHPLYKDSSSKVNDKYLKIVSESMSGSSKEETNKNYSKIIKNIVKETVINKSDYMVCDMVCDMV